MNRFFTRPELLEAYRLPQHVQDQLFAEVIPVSVLRSASSVVQSSSSGISFCGRFATFPTSAFEGRRPDPLQAICVFRMSVAERGLSGAFPKSGEKPYFQLLPSYKTIENLLCHITDGKLSYRNRVEADW